MRQPFNLAFVINTAIVVVLLYVGSSHQVNRSHFFPHNIGDSTISAESDDMSSPEIPLTLPYSYFSKTYRSIFVNTNGMLSFDTEIPSFYNIQFPLNYPVIAVLYSDIDIRERGTITYGETQSQEVLDKLTDLIRKHFSYTQTYRMGSAFLVTWEDVGYYNKKGDKVNTFQIVLTTNGDETFAVLQYADNGIQWIQSGGKTPGLPDAKAQVGFMTSDGRIYTLHGSGTDHVKNLDKLSNIGLPGVWIFRIGKLAQAENIGLPDQNLGSSALGEFPSCSQGYALCHIDAICIDHSKGYCCECKDGYYGNGQNCLPNDIPQRLNGKVSGIVNGVEFENADLHAYVVTADGRQYTAISRIPETIGFDMQSLVTVGGIVGWLFAVPRGKAKNGFQLTGGLFNRTVTIEYPQTGHSIEIKQQFTGLDAFGHLQVVTKIKGTAPVLPSGSQLQMNDHFEEYSRVLPGLIRLQATQAFHLDNNPSNVETPFKIDQVISFDECLHALRDPELDTTRLSIARSFYTYDSREQIVRYATTNKISTLGGDDPCKEGRKTCGADSSCIVENDTFRCVCNPGYEFHYVADEVGGQKTICVDINECTTGRDNCHSAAVCANLQGSFQCTCRPGFVGNGIQCTKTQTCDDLNCGQNAECIAVGPSQVLECRCVAGYQGDGYQCISVTADDEDCSVNHDVCDLNAACIYDETHQQYTCRCQPGYRGDGITCIEDEGAVSCNIINNCHPQAACHYDSQLGQHQCRCNVGYEGDGYHCNAADVSCAEVNICSINAKCTFDRLQNKYVCICNEGYNGDGITCRLADECDRAENCGSNAQCMFDSRSQRYHCVCDPGYVMGTNRRCTADNTVSDVQCNIVNNCHAHAQCIYDDATFRHLCRCNAGYDGDGITCKAVITACNVFFNCDANAACIQDPTTQEHQCQCREGYVGDGYNCVQGRPCSNDPYICDDNADCVQLADLNQYICQCLPGFVGDGHTCTEGPKFKGNFLIASQGMSIVQMPLQASRGDLGKPIVMEPLQTAIGVDVDCTTGHVYWSDVSGRAIKRSNYDGSNVEIFISDDVESPEGIAIDWISHNIFWTDSLKDTIEVARLDSASRERKVLFETNLVNPRGIAVHPRGLLFWTDWNRLQPKIETAHMDGTGRQVLIDTNIELPNSLTIDNEREELCWADAGKKRIECCNLFGQNRRTIVSAISYPFGLTNNKQYFYWTDWETRKIEIINKVGGRLESPLEPPLGGSGKLYGVVAVPERCLRANNACSAQNGGCSHICLPNGYGGRTCACPDYVADGETPVCFEN